MQVHLALWLFMDYIFSVIYFNDEKSMLSLSNKPIGFTYVLDTEHRCEWFNSPVGTDLDNNVRSPYCRGTIESKELARLIEFTMLHFRQVHLPVQFLLKIKRKFISWLQLI